MRRTRRLAERRFVVDDVIVIRPALLVAIPGMAEVLMQHDPSPSAEIPDNPVVW